MTTQQTRLSNLSGEGQPQSTLAKSIDWCLELVGLDFSWDHIDFELTGDDIVDDLFG